MSDYEHEVDEALREWRVVGARGDWENVLRRAAKDERPHRLFGKPVLVAAAVLGTVLIAAPASGLVSTVAGLFERDEGVRLVAELSGPEGDASFEMLARGAFVTVLADKVVPRFRSREEGRIRFRRTGTLQWKLRHSGTNVQHVRILYRGASPPRSETLCSPCAHNPSGAFTVTQTEAVTIFNDRASVEVITTTGTRRGALSVRRVGP